MLPTTQLVLPTTQLGMMLPPSFPLCSVQGTYYMYIFQTSSQTAFK